MIPSVATDDLIIDAAYDPINDIDMSIVYLVSLTSIHEIQRLNMSEMYNNLTRDIIKLQCI